MNMCQIFSKPHQFVTLAIRNKTRENIGKLLSLETNYSCNFDNFAIMSHIVWDLIAFHFEKAICAHVVLQQISGGEMVGVLSLTNFKMYTIQTLTKTSEKDARALRRIALES